MLISRKVIEMLKEDFVLLYDKDNFDKVTIIRNFLSESQKKYALDITKEALKMYDYPQKSAEYIVKNFNRKYGGRLDCFISLRNYHGTDCAYIDGYMIGFTMGQYFVVIKKGSKRMQYRLENCRIQFLIGKVTWTLKSNNLIT